MDALAFDIIRYNHFLRRRFAAFFEQDVPWSVLVEDHGTSHQNMASVFMHGCNMEDWWLHYVRPGKPWDGPRFDGFSDATAMRRRVEQVEHKTSTFLRDLTAADLQRRSLLDMGSGKIELSLGQLLTEAVVEDMHHRGEIMAMLWRKDLEPPYISFAEWSTGAR